MSFSQPITYHRCCKEENKFYNHRTKPHLLHTRALKHHEPILRAYLIQGPCVHYLRLYCAHMVYFSILICSVALMGVSPEGHRGRDVRQRYCVRWKGGACWCSKNNRKLLYFGCWFGCSLTWSAFWAALFCSSSVFSSEGSQTIIDSFYRNNHPFPPSSACYLKKS